MGSSDAIGTLSRRAFVGAAGMLLAWGPRLLGRRQAPEPREAISFSGVYPHLAYWNREGECGAGAVVPWAGKLWVITYGPHLPNGSSDKLYEIDETLQRTIRPESVGGTPANRLIHRESNQLFIGPYVIDAQGNVRVIPPQTMPGRHTANARHLTDPAHLIYYCTMEEGLYEVDVASLDVNELYPDANRGGIDVGTILPGYHGKGAYSGQSRLVYANNGERTSEALKRPDVPSGVLAEWDGSDWHVVRRNQFCEVTGPGGIEGNANPATDPIWSTGWDHRSLLLEVLDQGQWHAYRLPKPSHCYDGAHGWNTEWPRIRDIGEDDLLMTMHGGFWGFPRDLTATNSAGIRPRSTYLKVIGDYCRWQNRIVLGCDDSAKSEFLNKRKAKGSLAGTAISNSNLWFIEPERLDQLGPARGQGAVWLRDPVTANEPSEPYLFDGFDRRQLVLSHDAGAPVTFQLEIDRAGDGHWQPLGEQRVAAGAAHWIFFRPEERGAWVRLRSDRDCGAASAVFTGSNQDVRPPVPHERFLGLAGLSASFASGGLLHVGGSSEPILQVAATTFTRPDGRTDQLYELGGDLKLRAVPDDAALAEVQRLAAIPRDVLQSDSSSLIYLNEDGKRFRLPRAPGVLKDSGLWPRRLCREVCTERDLFQAWGIFYELPAENAGGFALIRPIAAHSYQIHDYASWRGLLVLTGIELDAAGPHIVRSDDGQGAVWLGVVDDLWSLGKVRGQGGPWGGSDTKTAIEPGVASDPYLCNGFDRKTMTLVHDADRAVTFTLEADVTGRGDWSVFERYEVPAGAQRVEVLPEAFAAYWVRLTSDQACAAMAWFEYE